MRKVLYTSVLILITLLTQAQPVSFKRNYSTDSTAFATAFTELRSLGFIVGYTENLYGNTNNVNLHLLKTDRDGNRLWDRIIKQYQTDDSTAQFSIQSITELKNGTLVLDMVYPYGERYVMKFDADGNKLWETYLHNTFADYFVYDRQVRERSSTMALEDNRVLVCGASFSTLNPRATLSVIAPDGAPRDYYYYRGFFNASYFVSDDHVYTTGIELTDSNESLVLSDIKTDGNIHYHVRISHKRFETIRSTTLLFLNNTLRVGEILSKGDTAFYENIYEYNLNGTLKSKRTTKLACSAYNLLLLPKETLHVLGSKCNSYGVEQIEKSLYPANSTAFRFLDSINNVRMLHKLHDGNYGIIFSRNNGVNFWKISSKGTFEDLKTAEGFFYPNPVKTTTTYIPDSKSFGKAMKITLTDGVGNSMLKKSFEAGEEVTLDLTGYREGPYIYIITTEEGDVYKGKLIKYVKN